MYDGALVFGLAGAPVETADSGYELELRDLTLSWSRYGYRGVIVEGPTVELVLDEALERGYRWCLVQAVGNVVLERWHEDGLAARLEEWLSPWVHRDFLALGAVVGNPDEGYGLDDQLLLVDVRRYGAFGRPAFGTPGEALVEQVEPTVLAADLACGRVRVGTRMLAPSAQRKLRAPAVPGWNLVDTSLRFGLPLHDLGPILDGRRLSLGRLPLAEARRFARYLRGGIRSYHGADAELAPATRAWVEEVGRQVANANRGVFLWNLEPYDDVRMRPDRFEPPISTLYSVASGFKPNVILDSLGFDEQTRVVFFDCSTKALEVKRLLLAEWDGEDFPAFALALFRRLPAPETYYHLWAGATPETLDPGALERAWARELELWGGRRIFKEHWRRYRELRHEFVHCDVLTRPSPLLDRLEPEPDAVIWWSNAFFTVAGNWLHTVDDRRRLYELWIEALAERSPGLFLYGSDFCNSSVNNVEAGEYRDLLSGAADDGLVPLRARRTEIRF